MLLVEPGGYHADFDLKVEPSRIGIIPLVVSRRGTVSAMVCSPMASCRYSNHEPLDEN
jgi:hypothetical protein